MTLVAYRDGVVAADSATWGAGGRVITGHNKKIRRLNSPLMAGALVVCAGASGVIARFHEWLEAGGKGEREAVKAGDGFQALIVHADGGVTRYDEEWLPFALQAPYHVLGAAEAFMLGALAAGASAKEAVRLAMVHTEGGAGEIQVEQLNPVLAAKASDVIGFDPLFPPKLWPFTPQGALPR